MADPNDHSEYNVTMPEGTIQIEGTRAFVNQCQSALQGVVQNQISTMVTQEHGTVNIEGTLPAPVQAPVPEPIPES